MRRRFAEICRFLVAGFANTSLTMMVYQVLVTLATPSIAYSIAWLGGLLFVTIVYPKSVFRAKRSWKGGAALAVVYMTVFVVGLLLITFLDTLLINPRFGILIVLIATTSMNYSGSRLAIAWASGMKGRSCAKV